MAQFKWDFFLAHASADTHVAEALYDLLHPQFKVFLDCRSLMLGDDWDRELAVAQSHSAVTLVLVSSRTEGAYYQREEIAAAVEMARHEKERHRVVPIFLDSESAVAVPYGLRLKHGLSITKLGGLAEAVRQLKYSLQRLLAMSPSEIRERHEGRVMVRRALRLLPQVDFDPNGHLGLLVRKYVFVGDYDEQRNRPLRQILSNLWIGDAFESIENSNIRWLAILFEVAYLNQRKLDLKPATWKSAFRILSDPGRADCFRATDEERTALGRSPRDYQSDDQDYWYGQLTTSERKYTASGVDFFLKETLGISWLCFSGKGITEGGGDSNNIPSRVFFVRNVPLSSLSYQMQDLGTPDDDLVLQ